MTFIIAEVGSNWHTLEDCLESIQAAKNCGADAVKFQMFANQDMYGVKKQYQGMIFGYSEPVWIDSPESEMVKINNWLPTLKAKADACGIEFMCTAFSPEGLRYVDKFVSRHKIASSDLSYPELLETAKSTCKPVIMSTGAASLSDIGHALEILGGRDVTLLYCVSAYPATNVQLHHIDELRKLFNVEVGYSCHTTDWVTAFNATKFHAARVIEKHFKHRDMDSPDSAHSLGREEFKTLCQAIRGKEVLKFPDCQQEKDMLLRHKRRLIATKEIKSGDILEYGGNFGVYRSLSDDMHGLSGFACYRINGRLAAKDLKPGDPIGPSAVNM